MVAAAWYAGWHAQDFPVANVSWDKYTHMTYSFAITTPDVKNVSLEGSSPEVLPDFVATAKKNGVKALVSVGGWTGSLYWSSAVGSPENRTAFVKTLTDFATQYELDGLDFDWEYPGNQGIGCNVISPNDTSNFLSFLQQLRKDPVGQKLILTAAAPITPWKGPDGNSLTDVSEFAKVLDYVAVMNYDISGPWLDYVGANAPLNDTCAPEANQQGSAVSALKAWTDAKFPAHQLVLGVPSYGHSFTVDVSDALDCDADGDASVLAEFPPFDKSNPPTGDAWADAAGPDECGVQQPPGGNYDFWGLVTNGFLFENGTVASGIDYRFDECSQTAYVYNETSKIMVSFDDAKAFAAKGKFIADSNLRGFAMWEAGGDFHDILLDSIRQGAGLEDDGGDDEGEDC
ncbi:chitinase [Panus rudis PR-1116 ss-1]|nr:chitinase [Panus rudis PR-1116 ss-1]